MRELGSRYKHQDFFGEGTVDAPVLARGWMATGVHALSILKQRIR